MGTKRRTSFHYSCFFYHAALWTGDCEIVAVDELLPEPDQEPPKHRSPDTLGRLLANVLFLEALLFALAVVAVVFLRPFLPWIILP